jgi:hypothetical protein
MKKFIRMLLVICCMLFLTACQSTVGNADEAKSDIAWEDVDTSGAGAADDAVASGENETSTLDDYVGSADTEAAVVSDDTDATLPEDGSYTSKEDVALYIHLYGHLPENFITKKDAEALGWSGGSLEPYAPGKCIGGSRFGNYEGLLPEKDGRTYTECDIDTLGADKRGAKRIVFSNDGLIYYTEDHYETFELLYGEED